MTPRQKDALQFLISFIREHGHSPTYDKIRVGIGLKSKSGIHRIMHGLQDQQLVTMTGFRACTVKPTRDAENILAAITSPDEWAARFVATISDDQRAALMREIFKSQSRSNAA